MEEALSFFRAFELWIYLLLGLGGLIYIQKFILSWQELREAGFGLERDNAQTRLNQAAVILVLLLTMAVSEFVLVSFVAPAVPGATPLPTPTLNLLATATTTLPAAAPTPEGTLEVVEAPAEAEFATSGCVPGQIEINRERIALLIDNSPTSAKQSGEAGKEFYELSTFAAYDMYKEYGGAPSSGTIYGIGKISGRHCVIVANDATVKAGAWFPITAKKNLRAQEIAMENHLPIIYLVDSAGVFLPLQDEIFPDKEHFGRIFRNNAVMSSKGIPQIAAIMGPCVAGGAYLPIMSDEALIVEGEGSVFLAGAHLVRAEIGEKIDNESLGGARVQSNVSGVTDYVMKDDKECIAQIRSLVDKFGKRDTAGFDRIESKLPKFSPKEIYGLLPEDTIKQYDMYEVIARIVDNSEIRGYLPF